MNLDDFIITCFCWIDEMQPTLLQGQRLRQRGPMPILCDSEVLTIEIVGSYLGLSQNEADGEIVPLVLEGTQGIVLGDRNYWLPDLQAFLRSKGLLLHASFRLAHSPKAAASHSSVLGRVRYLIDTVFGQRTSRCHLKRMWARDLWHLRNRVLRVILMHTLCFWFNQQVEAPCLQFDQLVA
jgi:hypothetical protein